MNDLENEQEVVTHPLEKDQVIVALLRLFVQAKTENIADFEKLIQCVSEMDVQLNKTTAELQTVKQELQSLRGQLPVEERTLFSSLMESLDAALRQGCEQLGGIKENIIRAAGIVARDTKGKSISGLNRALDALGVRKAVNALQTHLSNTLEVLEKGMARVEAIGRELREAGGHLQNAGRVIAGKERRDAPEQAGRVTIAILTPLRRIHAAISKIKSLSERTLNRLDKLEKAAKEERPSVKDALKTLKNQRTQSEKARKRQEPSR